MNRTEKIALLSRVLEGQTEELQKLLVHRGRLYSQEERAIQKVYLTGLFCRTATDEEVTRMFGRYDLSDVPGAVSYLMPNGMRIFFQPQ